MNIYITGGGTNNKGALSMLETTIKRLTKLYDNDVVFYVELLELKTWNSKLPCNIIRCDYNAYRYALKKDKSIKLLIETLIKTTKLSAKRILKQSIGEYKIRNLYSVDKIISKIDIAFDISGFSLSSKWDDMTNKLYLYRIELFKKYKIPYILLPQSFGPFNYNLNRSVDVAEIKNHLSDTKFIFAREKSGYDLLKNKLQLNNVYYCKDIVLMSRNNPDDYNKNLTTKGEIGIIPNLKISSSIESAIEIYIQVITYLLKKNLKVYIINHTSFDIVLAKKVYAMFADKKDVFYIENDYGPDEFKEYISQLDFLIASRYHSVIHAYHVDTPCVIMAWAEKYHVLASIFNQKEYVYDAKQFTKNKEVFYRMIDIMNKNCIQESMEIHKNYKTLIENEKSAFDILSEING